jgi:hypothetical protein
VIEWGSLWPWLTLALLGGFHGLNPAMGWLFAVALGLQERRESAVVGALGPIALGHAVAIGVVAFLFGVLQLVVPARLLLIGGGLILLAFAAGKAITRFRHRSRFGMRIEPYQLVVWSFLMATAHGAGLMLVPVLARTGDADAGNHVLHATALGDALGPALGAVAIHTAAMLIVMAVVAVLVYEKLGVEVLRRAWVNLDLIWVGALVIAGLLTLGSGLWQFRSG